ncbi:hypothetical protein [Streptomyces sp. NPDC021622]|uniref:hypothetical protein n=1 Tax=Streptomyces sp. NPDC021622 TaxID=3155013 RepID=UPI00340726FB
MTKRKRKRARTATVPLAKTAPLPAAPQAPLLGYLRRRRGDLALYLLRGTCYGLGTSLAGLVLWWIQQHT